MNEQDLSALYNHGHECFQRGEYAAAITHWEETVSQARTRNDTTYELLALINLCAAWSNVGNYQKMVEVATHALRRASQLKQEPNVGWAGIRLANALAVLDLRGRWPEIKTLLLDGLATARSLVNAQLEAEHLRLLGAYAVELGETEEGFAWLQELLNMSQPPNISSYHYYRGSAYYSLSRMMRKSENYPEAVRYAELSVGEFREDGNPHFTANAQVTLARAEKACGNLAVVHQLLDEVKAQAREHGWRGTEQEAEYVLSEVERETGHLEAAELAARSALILAQEQKRKEEEVECLLSLGQVLQALGRHEEARETLEEAKRLSEERRYADHFEKAEELLKGEG